MIRGECIIWNLEDLLMWSHYRACRGLNTCGASIVFYIVVFFSLEFDIVTYVVLFQLFIESVSSKQLQDALLFEKHTMEKDLQLASSSLDFYDMKAARIEDQVCMTYFVWNNLLRVIQILSLVQFLLQLKFCSDQVQKLAEERFQNSVSLENTQKQLSDIRRSSHQARESLEDSQSKIERSRVALVELQIELERQR